MNNITIVIPARSGSKRIQGKNTRFFNGEPILAWPIRAAQCIGVRRIIVSTDSEEIASLAIQLGAEVPFIRPKYLSDDDMGTAPVVRHAISEMNLDDQELVVCLYPTSTIGEKLLLSGVKTSQTDLERFTVGIGKHKSPFERSVTMGPNGECSISDKDHLLTRTQDLPTRFFDAGKFYSAIARKWINQETMMSEPFLPFFLPAWASVDIDEEDDWEIAEALHKAFLGT